MRVARQQFGQGAAALAGGNHADHDLVTEAVERSRCRGQRGATLHQREQRVEARAQRAKAQGGRRSRQGIEHGHTTAEQQREVLEKGLRLGTRQQVADDRQAQQRLLDGDPSWALAATAVAANHPHQCCDATSNDRQRADAVPQVLAATDRAADQRRQWLHEQRDGQHEQRHRQACAQLRGAPGASGSRLAEALVRDRWTAAEDGGAQHGGFQWREKSGIGASIGERPTLAKIAHDTRHAGLLRAGQLQHADGVGHRQTSAFERRQLRMDLRAQVVGQWSGHRDDSARSRDPRASALSSPIILIRAPASADVRFCADDALER